jgi:CRP-like cAMP-binding protein
MPPELIGYLRYFVNFTDEELAEVWPFFVPKSIKKGDFLLQIGETATEIAFTRKGLFRIYFMAEGKESTRFFGKEGIFITSLPSFITQQPSIEYVQALEDSEVLMLSYEDLQKMYGISQKWESLVRQMVEMAFVALQNRVYSLISESAATRFDRLKASDPALFQRVPQYHIANYMGIAPETLSRLRKQL